jgi:hypothetical protein
MEVDHEKRIYEAYMDIRESKILIQYVIIEPDSDESQSSEEVTPSLRIASSTPLYMSCYVLAHLDFATIGLISRTLITVSRATTYH